jgi:hypothetical protein
MTAEDDFHYLPIIVRASGLSDADRKFVASLLARTKRGPVRLSVKQASWLGRIVRDFRNEHLRSGQ